MQAAALKIFVQHFSDLGDPRIDRKRLHNLFEIIVMAVVAVICGCESFCDIEEFGKTREKWFKSFMALQNGIPSHDTFNRVFALLDPKELEKCFISWMRSITELSDGEVIALDGKTVRRSFDKKNNKGAIHLVNAWACQNGVSLGQIKTAEKSNEITAIPELIKLLDLKGCIVTIDAMGTQKSIVEEIIKKEADYVLALKGNHGQLHRDVCYSFDVAMDKNFEGFEHDYFEESDRGHGRIETRKYWTLSNLDWLLEGENWTGLKSICMATCTRTVEGKTSEETRYFISSLNGNAKQIGNAVRSHWAIENNLHWTLDVSFREDECRIRKRNAPENFSMLRKIALNLLKKETTLKRGIKGKRLKAGWDNKYLERVLTA